MADDCGLVVHRCPKCGHVIQALPTAVVTCRCGRNMELVADEKLLVWVPNEENKKKSGKQATLPGLA